jgi:O-antigen/teichoic acid export membrane protein
VAKAVLFRHTLLYLPAQIIGPLFLLISVVVWTHVTSDATLGVITLVTASHELLQTVFLAGWSQYALRFFGSYQTAEGSERFYRTENAVMLLSVIVQSVIAVVILRTVIAPKAGPLLFLAVVAYVVSRSFNLYIAERARVRHEITVYSIQTITGPAAGFLVGLVMIRLWGEAPEWPIMGYAVAQFVAILAVLPIIKFGRKIGPVDRAILRDALQYGIPLIAGGGLGWLSLNASRFIVSHMHGLGAAGLFAVGYGLGQRAATVAAMLVTASAFPIAVRQMEQGGSKLALRQLADNGALLAAVLLPSVAGIFMLRDDIVHLLIAAPFQAATLVILPLSALAGAIRNFRAHFGDQVFLLHRRTQLTIAINGVEAVVAVAAGIVMIARWGPFGGAIASVVATSTAAVMSFSIGLTIFGLRPAMSHLVRIAIATAAMSAGLAWLPPAGRSLAVALHIGLGVVFYVAAIIVLYGPTIWGWRARAPVAGLLAHRARPFV